MKYVLFTYAEDACHQDEVIVINNICGIWDKNNTICILTNGGMSYLRFFSFEAKKRAWDKLLNAMEKA